MLLVLFSKIIKKNKESKIRIKKEEKENQEFASGLN